MYIAFYNADKQIVSSIAMNIATEEVFEVVETNADGYISALRLNDKFTKSEIMYVRFTLIGSGRDVVISINEPRIPDHYNYAWIQIEKYFSGNWYYEIEKTAETIKI